MPGNKKIGPLKKPSRITRTVCSSEKSVSKISPIIWFNFTNHISCTVSSLDFTFCALGMRHIHQQYVFGSHRATRNAQRTSSLLQHPCCFPKDWGAIIWWISPTSPSHFSKFILLHFTFYNLNWCFSVSVDYVSNKREIDVVWSADRSMFTVFIVSYNVSSMTGREKNVNLETDFASKWKIPRCHLKYIIRCHISVLKIYNPPKDGYIRQQTQNGSWRCISLKSTAWETQMFQVSNRKS